MYNYHHHYHKHSVLKKNQDKEYAELVKIYGEENIELEKELTLAYHYKCWINDDGYEKPWHRVFHKSENTFSIVYDDEDGKDYDYEV